MSMFRLSALCGIAMALCSFAAQADFAWRVDSRADLERILPGALPGDVFELASGNWGALSLRRLNGEAESPIILRALDPTDPPVFDSLDLRGSSHLRIESLALSLTASVVAIDAREARDIAFEGITITGPGRGTGIDVTNSQRVTIIRARLARLGSGVVGAEPRSLTLSHSTMTDLAGQAVALRGGRWLTLDGNSFTRFAAALERPDLRPPAIVEMAMGVDMPAHILVKDTLIDSGTGPARPGLVIGDALEQHPDLAPVRDVTLSGLVIVTATRDGLAIGPADGVRVSNNAVLRGRLAPYATADSTLTTPQLRLSQRSRNVVLQDNWAGRIPNGQGFADWDFGGNIVIQDDHAGQVNHYDRLFGDPDNADVRLAFRPRDGSLIDQPGSGPGLLRDRLTDSPGEAQLTSATEAESPTLILSYDAEQGLLLGTDADGGQGPRIRTDRGAIPLGDAFPVQQIPREMIGPLFDTNEFTLRLRLRGQPGWDNAGEVLRLHPWMALSIDRAGGLVLDFRSAESPWKRLVLRTSNIRDGAWHDVEIRFDTRTADGLLSLHHGADTLAEVAIHGPTPPLRHWALALGNPFGDRDTWEGEIGGLTLTRRSMP